jgi:phenylpropionate dioxygenase-like ring-hydroxylating dioxygenase large terminal subunit
MTYLTSNLNLKDNSVVPLLQFNNKWAVQKVENETNLINNSCLHRGALIVKEKQEYTGNLVCPLHRWTYDQKGNLLGEPFPGAKGCLKTFKTSIWNNLIFKGEFQDIDLPDHLKNYFNMDNYVHTKTEIMTVKSSWQIFMEVYLDLYHVRPYHAGLGNFVDMDNFSWHFGNHWSIQEVMLNKKTQKNPNKHFRDLEKMIAANYPDIDRGALWMTIYPNIMIEWYPNMLAVSTVWPSKNLDECLNIIEYHHLDSVAAFDPAFVESQIQAYHITADEDAEICELIQQGRSKDAVWYSTHPVLEKGIEKFYEYLADNDVSKSLEIRDFE